MASQWYEETYTEIINNSSAIGIMIELGKKERVTVPDLLKGLSLTKSEIKKPIKLLEKSATYIKQNPSNDDLKPLLNRKYMLTLKGMLFLKNMKRKFPEYADSLNFFF